MLSSSNIQILSNAILKASKNLRRDFGELEKLQNSRSNITSFVENSYQNTQDLISLELKNARPDWSFFFNKDEKSKIELSNRKEEKFCLIRPISGISNFSKGISYFATSAIYYNKFEPEAAVVYDPIKDELYYAEKGRGAFVNNSRIRFSSTKNLSKALFVFDDNDIFIRFTKTSIFNSMNSEFRIFGCRCLDLANLSSGKIDCYVSAEEFDKTPDPGLLFIKESGGIMYKKKIEKNICFYSNNNITDILENKL